MRIAIDMTATPKNKTGIGRYMQGLLQGLQTTDKQNEYILFVHNDDAESFRVSDPRFSLRTVNSRLLRNTWIRILWEQLILPFRLRREKAQIIHCPNFTAPYLTRVIYPSLKIIGTFHDMSYFFLPEFHVGFKREMFKWYIHRTAKTADKIITISENSRKDIPQYCRPRNPDIAVTLLGADERFSAPEKASIHTYREKYDIKEDYILYVGTLEPRKNIENLIEAYRRTPSEIRDNYQLVISGKKGWFYQSIYETAAKSPELQGRVHFTDFVDDVDLPALMHGASAFAYVSIYEGFGIPVIESLASGTLTITSRGSSLEEIAGDAAYLCDPRDPETICRALTEIFCELGEDEKARRIRRGIDHAAQFTWKRCAEQTVAAYETCLRLTKKSVKTRREPRGKT